VTVVPFHTVPKPVSVILPVPNAIDLTLELVEAKSPVDNVLLARSKVPKFKVKVLVEAQI
jgi:hypothetical protein